MYRVQLVLQWYVYLKILLVLQFWHILYTCKLLYNLHRYFDLNLLGEFTPIMQLIHAIQSHDTNPAVHTIAMDGL